MKPMATLLKRLLRAATILLLVTVGATLLVRFAPGYLSDAREMDPRYADAARTELSAEAVRSGSVLGLLSTEIRQWTHGDLGISRQYEAPVSELIWPRLAVSGGILLRSLALGWALACSFALVASAGRKPSVFWQLPSTLLLGLPTAALATVCLLSDSGGPVLVLSLLLAARDFKFVDRILRKTWREPQLLYARSQGIGPVRLLTVHILPRIASPLLGLLTLSIVTALSALIPVEVIFSVPGIGQLAWNAALNRDLPVLLAVTLLMAIAVTCAGMITEDADRWKAA